MRALVVFLLASLVFFQSGETRTRIRGGQLSAASLKGQAEGRELLDAEADAEGHNDELSDAESNIFNNLTLEQLLQRVGVDNATTITTAQLHEVLHLISAGYFTEKPVVAASEGNEPRFLLLTADLLVDEFGNGEGLTRNQFRRAAPTVLSCLSRNRCALSTDLEFVEDHDHEDHEEHDHEDHEEDENHEDHEGHDHEEDHEGHDHEEHEAHEHEEHEAHEHEEDHEGHDHEEHEGHEHEDHEEHEHEDHEEHEHEEEHESHGHEGHDDHDNHESHGHDDHDDEDDDDTTTIKIVALTVLFVEAMCGALIPIVMGTFKGFVEVLSYLNSFAGGVILSTGVIHLIPHVMEYEADVDGIGDYPLGMAVVALSFVMVFYVEHILFDVHSDPTSEAPEQSTVDDGRKGDTRLWHLLHEWKHSLVLLAATSVHSFLEALVVGLENDSYTVWILFASIAGHKGVTAMALSSRFSRVNAPFSHALSYALIFALTAPIAILIGTTLDDVPSTTNLILTSMSTGTFLYIGAYEVISDEFHNNSTHSESRFSPKFLRHLKFLVFLAGVLAIAGVAFVPHPDHGHDGHCH